MEDLLEIIKLSLPSLILFVLVYFVLKQFFQRERGPRGCAGPAAPGSTSRQLPGAHASNAAWNSWR